jgi:hypothetical protein
MAGRRLLTHAALFNASQTYPNDTIEAIADRLAARHHWTAEERSLHLDRLRDIRRTSAMIAIHGRALVPAERTQAALDVFFASIDRAFVRGQQTLEDTEDL